MDTLRARGFIKQTVYEEDLYFNYDGGSDVICCVMCVQQ
jgi:hypothetical protein